MAVNKNQRSLASPQEMSEEEPFPSLESRSPLWLVTQDAQLNEFITYLQSIRDSLLLEPDRELLISFSRLQLDGVRKAFSTVIRSGEQKLHQLSQLICEQFLSHYLLRSVVIGEVQTSKERFTLMQDITPEELHSSTDLDLGNRQLDKLQFRDGEGWSEATLVANFVDYQPTEPNEYSIHKVISRIKAEEEIWNKVVDEIFDIDSMVLKDKSLRHLSRYVKDIFGIKLVVGGNEDVFKVQSALAQIEFNEEQLLSLNCDDLQATRIRFMEVKNYLSRAHRKRSGWEAMKSVVTWSGKTFEIQVQPLRNYLHERELLTRESHAGFKAKREQVRDEIARQIPLFDYYRSLLHWLFVNPHDEPPTFPRLKVELTE